MRTGAMFSVTVSPITAIASIGRDPAERIRKGVNLLMIVSMLLSMLTPLYAPIHTAPSFASLDELRALSALATLSDVSSASSALPDDGAVLDRGAVRSKNVPADISAAEADRLNIGADQAGNMSLWPNAMLLPESVLTPAWFKAPPAVPHVETQAGAPEALDTVLTPAWMRSGAQTQDFSSVEAVLPLENSRSSRRSAPETATPLELSIADASFFDGETMLLESGSLDALLAPTWLRASTGGSDFQGILHSPPEKPLWAPLSSTGGICIDPEFSFYHYTPISMTMGNTTGLYTFTAVLTNTSATSAAGPLTFTLSLPANFSFVGNSASAVNENGALQVTQPANNTGGVITFIVSHASPLQTLPPGGVVTFTYRLIGTPNGAPNPDLTLQVNGGGVDPDCTATDSVNTNYCPLPGQLPITLTPPPYLVSMGNSAGDLYTVTLTNSGAYSLTDVSFRITPSQGFFFIGSSAVMTHSVYGSLTAVQPAGNTAEGVAFEVRAGDPYPASALAPGETITLVMRLGTTANAKSGQPLIVSVHSGLVGAELQCTETRENIATGRGNLFLRKSVSPAVAAVGQVVTFTIRVDNTGLGDLYAPAITDTLGPGLIAFSPLTYSQPLLRPNETFTYLIPAEVVACVGVTNTALAWWTIGNDNGQATASNPVSDTVNVRISNPLPQIAVEALLPEVAYCQPAPYSVNVPITITNSSAGAAADFALDIASIGSGPGLDFSTTTPGWVVNNGVISYTANNGLLRGNETVTLTLTITYSAPVCGANAGAFQLTPRYADACFPAIRLQGQSSTFSLSTANAPTLSVDKTSSIDADLGQIVLPGDTVFFTVTVSGNTGVLSGSQVFITDVLPTFFPANLVTITTPGATQSGNIVTYTPTISTEPAYAFSLTLQATYPQAPQCSIGALQNNVASATSPFCTTCLNGEDRTALVFADWDPLYPGSRMTAANVLLDKCRTTALQTVAISLNQPITWATTVFTDPLAADGVGPVEVVSGSVQVFVDGVDRTQDVTITTTPTLTIAFGNIGVYSTTALITITYELTAPVTAAPGAGWYFVDFAVGGYEDGACGGVRRAPVRLEVLRNTFELRDVLPDVLNSCSVNQVSLNFDGAFYPGLGREIVAVFQTDVGDIITPTDLTLSGSLSGQNVTVTTGVVGDQQFVTFTVVPTAPIVGPGAISFPLYRACASTSPISATLTAPDYCQVPVVTGDLGGATTLRPHVVLSLFGGGSVKERNQEWGFVVRNYGAITATSVVVTNTLPVGFVYGGHTPAGVTVQTGTLGLRQTLTFTVPAVPPFGDVEVTITGTAESCLAADQLWAGMTTSCGAVGPNPGADYCQGIQLAALNYREADGILLTSNDQAAIIPLCSAGDVTLIVKNATLDNELYNFVLREILTDAVYVPGSATISILNSGNVLLPATPFTPTSISPLTPTLPYTQVLIWDSQAMTGYPQSLIDALAQRDGKDEIHITFQVRTFCSSPNPTVAADGSATNTCGTRVFKSEDARSVLVSYPSVRASKTVRNLTEGGPAARRVFAGVGDQLVWNVAVDNISTVDVRALLVTDTLPGNVTPSWFNVTAVSPVTTSQVGRTLNWLIYSDTTPFTPALPALTTQSFLITGTVTADVCTQPLINEGSASVGCSLDDVCPAEPYSAQAEIDINPGFSMVAADATLDQCAAGPLMLSITNNGARAGNVVITYTLPTGFAYAGLAPATNPLPTISPAVGTTGTLVFSYTTFNQLSTATLAISVTNDLQSPGACRIAGSGLATLSYYDTCGVYYPNAVSDAYNVTVRRSDVSSLNIQPISQTVEAGQRYTWTIALTNTGDGIANNLVVTATLGNGWAPGSLIVSNGTSQSTSTPPVTATVGGSTVVTWVVGALPTNEAWTAQLSAVALVNQTNYRILAEASTVCSDGGCVSAFSDIAYNIPLQSFDKSMTGSGVSIAEPFTYTITADFYGNVQYTDTVLVDRLPHILGSPVFSVTGILTSNTNAANAWVWQSAAPQAITFTTSSVTRTVFGPDQLTITVTGFISNVSAAQQGVNFTNSITLSTSHDGQRWIYTDAVTGSIREPVLQIDKSVTPFGDVRLDSVLTYTLAIYHAYNSDATAYDVVITDAVPSVLAYVPGSLQVTAPSGAVVSATLGNLLTITVTEYPVSPSPILVTYQATVTQGAEPASTYVNTASVRWTSRPGNNPHERNGSGLGPNDYSTNDSTVFGTALVDMRKVVEANILPTVGDAITYTVAITIPTGSVRNLVVTDTLPAGLLYSSSASLITVTTAPAFDLPPYTITTPSATQAVLRFNAPITNTTGETAVISWTFRLLVDNSASNFHGASKTNIAVLTYSNAENGTFTGSGWAAPIQIYEPLLHIGKSYTTADACDAALFVDNFNRTSLGAGWVISGSGWTLTNGFLRSGNGQRQVVTYPGGVYTDFSFSGVFSSTDSAGDVGFIFRAQNAQNYYRFLWNRGGSGSSGITNGYVLERVVNDVATTLASSTAGGYTTYRWYHVEIRAVGNTFTVYVDGTPVLSATDPLNQFPSGSVGFFTHLQTYAFFDDVLVTRMGDAGCTVESGDVITYTLTISNQERLTGHNLLITDILPAATQLVTYTASSSDGASTILSGPATGATGVLTWTVDRLNPTAPFNPLSNSMLQITLTVRILGDVAAGDRLTNQALLRYDGQAGSGLFGIERGYSGGSHSATLRTPDAAIIKSSHPPTATIGQTLQYTITFPGVGGIAANLYTATLTDALPVGFRMVGAPQVIVSPPGAISPADIDISNSTTKTLIIQFTQVPSYTQVTAVITAVVENLAINQNGVQYTNTAALGWFNREGQPIEPVTSNPVTTMLVEPALIIEKSAYPTSARPGDTVFYTLRIYHAPTSTVPAYNVFISDTLSSALSYISGSWEANNSPTALAATGSYTTELPDLQAFFPLLDLSVTESNPLILRYQAVVDLSVAPGSLITNVADVQWTSLPTDPFGLGEIRDGSGDVNDYRDEDDTLVSLDQFTIVKSGPLTVTAGSWVTYVVLVSNGSPFTGTNARVVDAISFRVQEITGTFSTPLAAGVCAEPMQVPNAGSEIVCNLGDMPPFSTATVTITGRIDPDVPDGALVDDYATFYIVDSNGVTQSRTDEAQTQVENETDLALTKSGPLTATAGGLITYTLVITNNGPSTARGVDAKDILPPGLTFLGGSSTSGACTSSICQIGDMQPGEVVTMVITASVGSNVTGPITNTGQVFAATYDPNPSNNRDEVSSTVLAVAEIHVLKTDFADPVYAGDTFLYQLLVTNTGPSLARNVILTDTLPEPLIFQGGSPGCEYIESTRQVVCAAGDVQPGGWYGALINVMVPATVTNNSVVTNVVSLGTATQVLTASSTLSDTEATTLLQKSGNPTNLALTKFQTPSSLVAGSPVSGVITYTVVVTNEGPSPATGVNVFDLYPIDFDLLAITVSKPLTGAGCTVAASCLIGSLDVGEVVTVTIVMQAGSQVVAGVYTNTAFVASAAPDLNLADNSSSVTATVTRQVNLQIDKTVSPNPVQAGGTLIYQITVTNTGPSDASSVVISDMLPSGFTPALVLSSKGGCAALPCTLGVLKPNESAWVQVIGVVSPSVVTAAALANTAQATALEDPVGVQDTVTPTLLLLADLAVSKSAIATAAPGNTIVYTVTATNLGPSLAQNVRITDVLPAGLNLLGVSGCTNSGSGQQVICALGDLAVGVVQTIRITATVDVNVYPGTSLENVVTIAGNGSDPNPLNNTATADTAIIGAASFEIVKQQIAPAGAVTAGNLVTYTVTFTNTGPGVARMVDVKDHLPPGFSLVSASAGVQGYCAGAICQFGTLPVGAMRTMTVVARVDSGLSAGVATNVAAVFSVDATDPATATTTTTVTTAAALVVSKSALNNPVYAGGTALYQIVVTNQGPSDAQNVVITDALPAGMTYAGGDGACTGSGAFIICAIGALPANASRSLLVQANVDSLTMDGLTLTNLVTATSPTASTPVTAVVNVTVQQPASGAVDLAIEKNGPTTATAGTLITYTLVVTNRGPGVANAVQIVDALPYAVIGLATEASQGICNNSVVCQAGDLAVGASVMVTITGWVRTETSHGSIVLNSASVRSNNQELTPVDNVASLTTTVEASARMSIEKTAQPAIVTPGGALSYRILVRNLGPSLARNVIMTDLLPLELESPLVSSARGYCDFNVCYLGDLPPGETVTILVMGNASPAATTSFTNTALLTTTTPIYPDSTMQTQVRTDVGDNADLILLKQAPATVSAGSPITYVLIVRNAGPSTAVNVQVQDALPSGVAIADLGGCASTGSGSVLCPPTPLVSLTAGTEISWTIVVTTNSDLPVGTTLQNRATVSSDTPDPNSVNNTAIAETSIIGQSDLSVYKVASSPSVAAGDELTYTVVLTNDGPSDAVSVRLVDILPPQVQLVRPIEVERSLLLSVPVICLDTVCETSVVRDGEILTFTLHVRVNPAVTHQTVFTNTATVYSPSDPDFSNNIARAPVTAERVSRLAITKQASPNPAITGAPLTYQIVVRNEGPSAADGVVVSDLLPAGFTVTSVSSSQGGCAGLPCALGSLPPNAEATLTIVGLVDPLQSAPLVNTAAVTATTPLTNTELSQVTITTTVSALANLSLLLNSTPTAIAGLTATVQAQVVNLGPSSAVGAIVTLTLPAGTSYQDVVLPPNWYAAPNADNTVTLTTTEILSPGASVPLLVQVRLDPGLSPGQSLEFTGEVASQTPDNDRTDNYASTDTSVIARADLAIYKTGPNVLLAGALVTYVITAENRGPSAASVRDLKDVLPAGVALQRATLEIAGNSVTACVSAICQMQRPITVGEVVTMTVVGLVDPALPDGSVLTNTATVFVENLTPDPNESNNQAYHAAPVATLAQIGIDKYDLIDPVEPDGLLVYVLVVTNTGPSLARNVIVTDTLPPHVTYHSTTGPCTEATPGTVVCTVGDLAVGARMLFLIVVKVNATAPNGFLLHNTVTLNSTTPLTNSTLFADEATRVLRSGGPQADLEVIKTTHTPSVESGDEVTFTLRITNHGPSPVRNAQLLDLLPGGLTLVRVQTSQGFCNAGVTCLLGALDFAADANGSPIIEGSAVVTIVARAAADLVDGVVLTNTAYVQSELVDPAPDNNLDDANITVSARFADVSVRKHGAQYATAGEVITYTVTVENFGPATARHVTLSDPMPIGAHYLSATPAPTSGSVDNPVWELGSMAPGELITIELVVQVDSQAPPALILVNTAYVSSTTPDLNLSNNQATATTQSYGAADLEVIKTADREIVYGDEVVYYTITVNNLGPSLSDRVDVKELIPPGTELLSLGASQGACVNAICQVGNIQVGEPVVITASVRIISPTFPPGTVLTNTAMAFTNTPDPNPANNTDSDSVTVGPVVNLGALKLTHVQTAVVGTTISYTVLVTNYGPSDAPAIVITDHLPYRLVYLWSTAVNGCALHGDEFTLVCNAGPLPAHRSLAVELYFFISALSGDRMHNRIVADAPGSNLSGLGRPESELEIPANPVPTAILMETYTLEKSEDALILRWKTLSEFMIQSFRLWRSTTPDRNDAILLTPDGIPASGVGNEYTYVDRDVQKGVTYWYWLETVTVDGGGWVHQVLMGRLGPDELLYLPLVTMGATQSKAEAAPEETSTSDALDPASVDVDPSHEATDGQEQSMFSVRLPLILAVEGASQLLQPEPFTSTEAEMQMPLPAVEATETPSPTMAPFPTVSETPLPMLTPTPTATELATPGVLSPPPASPTPIASAATVTQMPSPTGTPTPTATGLATSEGLLSLPATPTPIASAATVMQTPSPTGTPTPTATGLATPMSLPSATPEPPLVETAPLSPLPTPLATETP